MNDMNPKRIKLSAILVILALFTTLSTSCFFQTSTVPELKQETHEPFEDMEQYVYDVVGPDIYFNPPVIDEENNKVNINLIQYEEGGSTALFDRARNAVNEFLMQHPDYCLNDYDTVFLNYEVRDIHGDYNIGFSQNSFHCGCHMVNRFGTGVDGVNTRYDQVNVVIIYSRFSMAHISDIDDVYALDMRTRTVTYSEITDFIVKHPSLQYMIVDRYDGDIDELVGFLQEIDSDVEIFIDEFEG